MDWMVIRLLSPRSERATRTHFKRVRGSSNGFCSPPNRSETGGAFRVFFNKNKDDGRLQGLRTERSIIRLQWTIIGRSSSRLHSPRTSLLEFWPNLLENDGVECGQTRSSIQTFRNLRERNALIELYLSSFGDSCERCSAECIQLMPSDGLFAAKRFWIDASE